MNLFQVAISGLRPCGGLALSAELPAPWKQVVLGDAKDARAEGTGQTFRLAGSGGSLWDKADKAPFAYTEPEGDFEFTVRLGSFKPAGGKSAGGVEVRFMKSEGIPRSRRPSRDSRDAAQRSFSPGTPPNLNRVFSDHRSGGSCGDPDEPFAEFVQAAKTRLLRLHRLLVEFHAFGVVAFHQCGFGMDSFTGHASGHAQGCLHGGQRIAVPVVLQDSEDPLHRIVFTVVWRVEGELDIDPVTG